MKTQFVIAAPMSGSGKTTVSRGLMAAFVQQGQRVQPFKCGPDYIDTKFHEAVCGRPSVNLDTFMALPAHVRELYSRYGSSADVCVVEGMMGMYDGYDRDRGSAAEIARELGLPVVLVVDARSAAYSMAPLLKGFVSFRDDVHVAGVIFNKVGSGRHEQMLRQVCEDLQLECFGCIPRCQDLEQASRYLGLDFSKGLRDKGLEHLMETFSTIAKALVGLGREVEESRGDDACVETACHQVVVARNEEAFSFIYQETLDAFGDVRFFDPETEEPRLEGCDLLYLPGGYPEKHLEALIAAEATRRAIRDYAERGGRIVAECGGMMYLCRSIVTDEGEYPMCGVLPCSISARKADRHLSLGYRQFTLDGRQYRGHEFHYTQFVGEVPPSVCQVYNAQGEPVATPILRYKNVLASYTHLYLNETNIY
ncbi:MAG: cobyrinate a,c-diamide synthase [Prevotella sp.]|nr:cobyrinate a,c-diamide synthase [Prevotella sp.]